MLKSLKHAVIWEPAAFFSAGLNNGHYGKDCSTPNLAHNLVQAFFFSCDYEESLQR